MSGAALVAVVGGSVLHGETARAVGEALYRCQTSTGGTALVDFSGGGGGLVNTGSLTGLVGVATDANGVRVGLLNCVAVPDVGLVPSHPSTTVLVGTPTVPTAAPSAPNPAVPDPAASGTQAAPSPGTGTQPSAGATPSPTTPPSGQAPAAKVAAVNVRSNVATVYPAAKGFKDHVVFSIRGLSSDKRAVKITGKAVLRKGKKVVEVWKIHASTSTLRWNGRIGKRVVAGDYVLSITVTSADGTRKTTTTKVNVSAKHLATRAAVIRSVVQASAVTAHMPAVVARAFKYGPVTASIRTVAVVHGPAKLVFSERKVTRKVALLDGTHTTKALPVPRNFSNVQVTHEWKAGAATLLSYTTIWRYKTLVP